MTCGGQREEARGGLDHIRAAGYGQLPGDVLDPALLFVFAQRSVEVSRLDRAFVFGMSLPGLAARQSGGVAEGLLNILGFQV